MITKRGLAAALKYMYSSCVCVYEMAVTFRENDKQSVVLHGQALIRVCCAAVLQLRNLCILLNEPESCRVETKMCSWRVVYGM